MSICWHCHWGWPKAVMDIYDAALAKLNNYESVLEFGPSHIVWEDENWEDHHIETCLKYAEDKRDSLYKDYSDEELAICKWSLEELLKIPYEQRDPEPEDYDGEHPENYPPPKGVVMVKQ